MLGGGFKYFLFSPLVGGMIQFDFRIFFRWVGSTTNCRMELFWGYPLRIPIPVIFRGSNGESKNHRAPENAPSHTLS